MLTLRARATAAAVVLVALVLGGGAAALLITLDHQLTASSDQVSRARLRDILAQARAGRLPSVLVNVSDDSVAQVIASDGTVLAASPNITGQPRMVAPGSTTVARVRTLRGPDDEETEVYRVWVESGSTPEGEVTVVAGTSLEAVGETTARVRTSLFVGVPLAVLLLGILMWLVVGRALGRLDRIRAEVDAIGDDQLGQRVMVAGPDDEVGRLAATMNRMLARIEASANRQRQLVADVSHDLQSPLAAQRIALELALDPSRPVDVSALRTEVLGATEEMERLVDELIVLASADEGARIPVGPVDLDEVVLEEAARARVGTDLAIDTSRVSAGPVHGNAGDLRRVVRNLLANAASYASTRIDLSVGAHGDSVRLDVVDDGPGIPPEERDLVFDRFRRGDRARTRGVPGSGLGLAIARSLAERSGGRLDLVASDGGAHFRLVVPALPARPDLAD